MQKWTVNISSPAATDRLGQLLAENLPDGSVIVLIGTLGAGKTRLVQAVAEQSGIEPGTVSSPTFVLLHEYEGHRPIYHFDAYRLENEEEFRRLGPDDYFEGTGLTFVEWGDKFPNILPKNRLEIQIEITGETTRRVILTGYGEQFGKIFKIFAENFPPT
ncbi:tRNA (adenosine(37)-N6)-threonylcarbamoyltransferase complex ATPase subunit type 1 TsaE [Planctomycetales bacterium]|nr:tRNA (adenosine(37)-N6)-threonylcarbamoyltransferase complex ATPase subunit type 1 TsaE [Planctomycetales bacterium]